MAEICQKCDKCSINCPVLENSDIKGLYRIFFENDIDLWNCSSCYVCESKCPNNLSIREKIYEKRREMGKNRLPSVFLQYFDNILEYGNVFGILEIINDRRENLGLKSIDFEKIKKEINELTSDDK